MAMADRSSIHFPLLSALSHQSSSVSASALTDELTQYVGQNPAVPEGDQFLRRVDTGDRFELDLRIAVAECADIDVATGPQTLRDAGDLVALAARETERSGRPAGLELQRQQAHVDEIAAVDPLEALGDHRGHAEEQRPFRGPVARRSRSVFLAGDHDERHAL